ncbi:AmmeMemoRadiSam system radical SAM enzyme [Candidatus Omnitrophota bacterium]
MIKEAVLYEKLDEGKVHCYLCNHHCKISPGKFGSCGARENLDGKLHTHAYGEVIAAHIDPIEKKPLYHFFPGSFSYSIATVGCNFKCPFCQNWQISQVSKRDRNISGDKLPPEDIVKEAKKNNCKSISYTYTEPTIFFEYAYDIAKFAKKEGLYNNFVTNGYMTKDALQTIKPYLDACNVDLKSFNEDFYQKMCGGHLEPVLDSIKTMKELGIWVEITTLIVPGQNDSDSELKSIAEFIVSVGPEVPWHISRFHPDYKCLDSRPTSIEIMRMAEEIGKKAGLKYIYLGNVIEGNNTYCYNCKNLLIERTVFDITKYDIRDERCPKCNTNIEGKGLGSIC